MCKVCENNTSRDITNQCGFLQTVDETGSPICSQCNACVMPNRGQGTMCDSCITEEILESELHFQDMGM